MKITRMDLADTGSPMGLATKILSVEKDLPIPVPIEELSHQLDVEKIAPLTTVGFEGGLLTDEDRSTGIILVNQAAPEGRRRFTIGHELGHFLIAHVVGGHACVGDAVADDRGDLRVTKASDTAGDGRAEFAAVAV